MVSQISYDDNLRIEILDRLISIKKSILNKNIFTHIDYVELIDNLIEKFNINDTINIIYMLLDDTTLDENSQDIKYKVYSNEIENMITNIKSTLV
jgi:hypothetical protein